MVVCQEFDEFYQCVCSVRRRTASPVHRNHEVRSLLVSCERLFRVGLKPTTSHFFEFFACAAAKLNVPEIDDLIRRTLAMNGDHGHHFILLCMASQGLFMKVVQGCFSLKDVVSQFYCASAPFLSDVFMTDHLFPTFVVLSDSHIALSDDVLSFDQYEALYDEGGTEGHENPSQYDDNHGTMNSITSKERNGEEADSSSEDPALVPDLHIVKKRKNLDFISEENVHSRSSEIDGAPLESGSVATSTTFDTTIRQRAVQEEEVLCMREASLRERERQLEMKLQKLERIKKEVNEDRAVVDHLCSRFVTSVNETTMSTKREVKSARSSSQISVSSSGCGSRAFAMALRVSQRGLRESPDFRSSGKKRKMGMNNGLPDDINTAKPVTFVDPAALRSNSSNRSALTMLDAMPSPPPSPQVMRSAAANSSSPVVPKEFEIRSAELSFTEPRYTEKSSLAQLLTEQESRCEGCNVEITEPKHSILSWLTRGKTPHVAGTSGTASSAHLCRYRGKLFCEGCMAEEKIVIPHRVVAHGDVHVYPVSRSAFELITATVYLQLVSRKYFQSSPALEKCSRFQALLGLRRQLCILRRALSSCELAQSVGLHVLLEDRCEGTEAYSVAEIIECLTGVMYSPTTGVSAISLGSMTKKLIDEWKEYRDEAAMHAIRDCRDCQEVVRKKCRLCVDPKPLLSFDIKGVAVCMQCSSVYHKSCSEANKHRCVQCGIDSII